MNLIMLVTDEHLPVPDNITVVQNFGHEAVLDNQGRRHSGESMYLMGDKEAFVAWLKPFDGVWVSDNPMCGDWHVVHVKADAAANA